MDNSGEKPRCAQSYWIITKSNIYTLNVQQLQWRAIRHHPPFYLVCLSVSARTRVFYIVSKAPAKQNDQTDGDLTIVVLVP